MSETPEGWKKVMVIDCTLPLAQEAQAKARVRNLRAKGMKASRKVEFVEALGKKRIVIRKNFTKPPPPTERERAKGISTLVK